MKPSLQKLSEHPVGGTVIGGLILSAIGLASWIVFPQSRDTYREAVAASWQWILANSGVSRWLLVTLLVLAFLGGMIVAKAANRKNVKGEHKGSERLAKALGQIELKSLPMATLAPKVPEDFWPNNEEARILLVMLDEYPHDIDLDRANDAASFFSRAHAHKAMEGLAEKNILTVRAVGNQFFYAFTPQGRDFAVKWIDEATVPTREEK